MGSTAYGLSNFADSAITLGLNFNPLCDIQRKYQALPYNSMTDKLLHSKTNLYVFLPMRCEDPVHCPWKPAIPWSHDARGVRRASARRVKVEPVQGKFCPSVRCLMSQPNNLKHSIK
ncbi:hypothetical protein KL929_003562 [Ogataea haglerorum]|nr:hypothetical protein KL951_003588 [Ogataea haglerorum]KAG7746703.1 hypothetical protein KL912_003832 [Ogataea haglerorum]KAG7786515.1 hypothetical protein KL910_003915 [Ogataea haglerorum]KAG7787744.1 hypothetical protein KL945_002893 [Ogataea haglerorum]KAG7796371.1 hypothetical protein KL929_003562 [Ogataea haglerorum]